MSIATQLVKERNMIIQARANNERASREALTATQSAKLTTHRINPRLSAKRQQTLRALNNWVRCHDPIALDESRKNIDEWTREFNAKAKRLGYSGLTVGPEDHLHIHQVSRREVR